MVRDTTLYDRLNISSSANENEIKKAYRKLSVKHHPDKNPDNKEEATKKFQEISEAYSILSDQEKRGAYDQMGMDYLKNNNEGGPGFDPSDIFSQFFGGGNPFEGNSPFGFNFGGQQPQRQKEDVTVTIKVTLKQIYCEDVIEVSYPQKTSCKDCDGTGSKNKVKDKCPECGGQGKKIQVVRMGPMIQQMIQECPRCNGTGKMVNPANKCKTCNGHGHTAKNKKINLPLRNGLDNGNKIQMENKGHIFSDGRTDLIIVISVIPDNNFQREGSNLITEVDIELYQSIFGFDKIIKHLDNKLLHISSSSKIEHNMIKKINGKGMMDLRSKSKGDLFIKFNVKYPKDNIFTEEEIETVKKILSKECTNEIQMEKDIRTGKIEGTKTYLDDYKEKKDRRTNSNPNEESPPQCTQQ